MERQLQQGQEAWVELEVLEARHGVMGRMVHRVPAEFKGQEMLDPAAVVAVAVEDLEAPADVAVTVEMVGAAVVVQVVRSASSVAL